MSRNQIGSEPVTSNSEQTSTDQSTLLSKCSVKKKFLCIIIVIIIVILVVTIPTVIIKTKKTNMTESSTVATETTNMIESSTVTIETTNKIKLSTMTTETTNKVIPSTVTTETTNMIKSSTVTTKITTQQFTTIADNPTTEVLFSDRSDVTSELQPSVGPWGNFFGYAYCPADTWAYGFQQRVQPQQDGDDTALNAVRLICRGKSGTGSYAISSYDGLWGDWGDAVYCNTTNNSFMYYAIFKIEAQQYGGDDTSANDFRSRCWNGTTSSGEYLQATNGQVWGSWKNGTDCAQGSAICGINTKFEGSNSDNTAMNGAFFKCCLL
ncbi:unnamed protein product [Adineta steineri]|uniref:Vitelline membrane outer layer 1-like protein n=1 Tax=Adineta steineri TaxID=433720 RepID=A0A814NZ69_9BILA|nr:unnamed protein product [Adineta steineri]CAF1337894.1 unnamed protein product [Adineta steineri]CAF3853979.1 unnamed protein product [Adineta steineri]CAF4059233.1 unnamed protein product [Adineta steineri]